ncbi:glucose PTS transporter subunit IIA [Corynebacterium sp. 11A]|uniref:glucose PTS transporter subunit IIA n=1 Tax=Corynebacterium sp. 11A TaxID=2080510 RepID=UPI00124DCDFB|nr:glucose PTS transporter subunit IIA [Corynebacterium sp. 11A]
MATKNASAAEAILANLGGPENIDSFTHCATRLRMQLGDRSLADQDALDNIPEVMGVVPQGSNGLQVIMGGGVANYYNDIVKLPGMEHIAGGEGGASKKSAKKEYSGVRGKFGWVDFAFEFLSDTFRPILWALLGASLIITILVLLDTAGIQAFDEPLTEQSGVYVLMHAMWRSVFYFLPIMVGASAAKKLGANEWVGAAIPAALLTPEFIGLKDNIHTVVEQGATEGIDIYKIDVAGLTLVLNNYGGQVFPPLLAAIGLFWVEKGLKKVIPEAVQMVFVPFVSLLVMIPLTAFVVGPFGIFIGDGIARLFMNTYEFSPFILAIIIPLLYPFLVPLGLHWPLNAVMLQNIATFGFDVIQGPMGAWNFACFGLVAGVLVVSVRERNRQMRQVATGGLAAGLLGGISEPSLYGIVLRFKKTYLRLLPGCFAGGIVMGLFGIKAQAFVFTSLLTIPAMTPTLGYAIGLAVAFFTSFFLVVFFDYRSKEEKDEVRARIAEDEADESAEASAPTAGAAETAPAAAAPAAGAAAAGTATAVKTEKKVEAPLDGTLVPLADTPDEAFAMGAVGKGASIDPSGDTVYAPGDGKVVMTFPTGHAVGLKLDNGLQMLIHVGLDTVNMNGEGFEVLVNKGDVVEAGTPLLKFDRAAIEAAGYSPITPVLVTNHKKQGAINVVADYGTITHGTIFLDVEDK